MSKKSISDLNSFLLDALFPPYCAKCGIAQIWLCPDCASLIEILENQYCPFCSPPRVVPDGRTCEKCRKSHKLTGLFCAASHENPLARQLINQLKYEPWLAKCLAPALANLIISHFGLIHKKDLGEFLWIPAPLHKKKLKQRGFNQSAEIAKELQKALGGELAENVLIKTAPTLPQAQLSKTQRQTNLNGVFRCDNAEKIKNRKILLVDDVFTTGATMEECARTLRMAGAKEVWGVAVAREG